MIKLKSSIPGFVHNPARNEGVRTASQFLEGRRKVDGAEGLWRIGNSLYDLENFIKSHPGGSEWISLTRGTDITESFECHHLTNKAAQLLPKFYVREASTPRSVPLTFKDNGFYHVFKKRALNALKDVDFHHPSLKSNAIADFLAASTILLCITAASTQSYIPIMFAGVFLTWTVITGHNYFHMKDNFRMYYFDLGGMSSKDWRVTHAMSHHIYPNTLWDFEVYALEPYLNWLPIDNKTIIGIFTSQLMSPVIWSLAFFEQIVKRYYSVIYEYRTFEFRDAVPFFLPITMAFFAPNITDAFATWAVITLISSFCFGMIGFNAAHHHPDIFHDGDTYRDDMDWGLLELDAVRERKVVDDYDFLVLTNFGMHGLHHLLPTVDHSYLPLCKDAFEQTCKDFNISTQKLSQWELVKGQFRQLSRREQKKNHR